MPDANHRSDHPPTDAAGPLGTVPQDWVLPRRHQHQRRRHALHPLGHAAQGVYVRVCLGREHCAGVRRWGVLTRHAQPTVRQDGQKGASSTEPWFLHLKASRRINVHHSAYPCREGDKNTCAMRHSPTALNVYVLYVVFKQQARVLQVLQVLLLLLCRRRSSLRVPSHSR